MKRMLSTGLIALSLILLVLAGISPAPRAAQASPQILTIAPSDDSFVDPASANVNRNYDAGQVGGGRLEVTYSNFPGFVATRRSYLKFPLSGVPGVTGRSLVRLTIVSNNIPAGGTVTLGLYAVTNDAWDETTITYSNRPALGALLQTLPVPAGTLGQITFGNPLVDNPVGAYIEQERAGDGTASFALVFTGGSGTLGFGGNILFDDREGSWDGINGNEPFVEPLTPLAIGLGETRVAAPTAAPAAGLLALAGLALAAAGLLLRRPARG